jgi:hypothetical protein
MTFQKSAKPSAPIPVGELVRRLVDRKPELLRENRGASSPKSYPRVVPQYGIVVTGRLVNHGAAIHPLAQDNRTSYFVKILTSHGPETLWGADLKRAIDESQTRPKMDSTIGAQRIGYQILKIPKAADAESMAGKTTNTVRRVRWRVESVAFFADQLRESRRARESHLKDHEPRRERARPAPDARLALAAQFADTHIRHPHDREEFLKRVKDKLATPSLNTKSSRTDCEPPTR